ncbi:MAG: DUF2905 family protein [Anaerolineae bacterium]
MDFSSLGKGILILGLVLVVVGGLFWALGRVGLPLGRLPGDIRIERDGFSCLVPIASTILLSILLTILLNIVIRLLNR